MKRKGDLWDKICARENVDDALTKAVKGKPLTPDKLRILEDRERYVDEIHLSLLNETYRFGELYSFTVYEPKQRDIHCPHFYPDRILHHAVMNVVIDLFESKFTADTYGSIRGRGVAMAANKLKRVLHGNPNAYYLQVDISQFYHSINHDVMKAQVRHVIKCRRTLAMLDQIIDTHNQGLAIGVYPSQYLGNLILSPIDHWAKEVARVPHYFRYMDDMLFVLPDKASAHKTLALLRPQIDKLCLSIKNNVRIAPVACGIDFIGYRFYPSHTLLRKRIKLKMQRIVRRLRKLNVSDAKLKRKTASHFGWCKHANCRNLLRKTFNDKIYLYEKNMEIKRLSDIKADKNWFGLGKDKRKSIEALFGVEIAFFEYLTASIKGEQKCVVRFAYPDNPDAFHYFITRSDVMKDRLDRDKDLMPFIATLKKVKNYTGYE